MCDIVCPLARSRGKIPDEATQKANADVRNVGWLAADMVLALLLCSAPRAV
jgi:hypothetical protein